MKRLIACSLVLLLVGCDQLMPDKSGKKKSGASDAVDTVVIQKGKMDAGRRAAKQIRQINADKQSDLQSVVGE